VKENGVRLPTYSGADEVRVLVYKRTHQGDPDASGRFGIRDCMGKIRSRNFDAVIGIGGIGSEAKSWRIDEKLNWVGIGARKGRIVGRGPLVTFDHFVLFDGAGPDLWQIAPQLARRMYGRHAPRHLMVESTENAEIEHLLKLASKCARSGSKRTSPRRTKCPKRRAC
jgi:hypothetical protein